MPKFRAWRQRKQLTARQAPGLREGYYGQRPIPAASRGSQELNSIPRGDSSNEPCIDPFNRARSPSSTTPAAAFLTQAKKAKLAVQSNQIQKVSQPEKPLQIVEPERKVTSVVTPTAPDTTVGPRPRNHLRRSSRRKVQKGIPPRRITTNAAASKKPNKMVVTAKIQKAAPAATSVQAPPESKEPRFQDLPSDDRERAFKNVSKNVQKVPQNAQTRLPQEEGKGSGEIPGACWKLRKAGSPCITPRTKPSEDSWTVPSPSSTPSGKHYSQLTAIHRARASRRSSEETEKDQQSSYNNGITRTWMPPGTSLKNVSRKLSVPPILPRWSCSNSKRNSGALY